MRPRRAGSPSSAKCAGIPPNRVRMLSIIEGNLGDKCMTTSSAAGNSAGSSDTSKRNASSPPADVPMATISRCAIILPYSAPLQCRRDLPVPVGIPVSMHFLPQTLWGDQAAEYHAHEQADQAHEGHLDDQRQSRGTLL